MTLPARLVLHVEAVLRDKLASTAAVSGGCISRTLRLEFESGLRAFLKWAPVSEHPESLFTEEARSLQELARTKTLRLPAVLDVQCGVDENSLLLEWLEPGKKERASQQALGRGLAALHQHHTHHHYGWEADNFIGSLPQSNRRHADWPTFWREERLWPQLERAAFQLEHAQRRRLEQVAEAAHDILADATPDGASLLHGDLWSGNVHFMAGGIPALIDPASYNGHREVDLAMSRLFGGFDQEFYDAYEEAWPCAPGWQQRTAMYQLYYLLVHINLFGGSYVGQTMSAVAQLGF